MQLNNARHEIFCQRVASGMAASRAYAAAGYAARGNTAEACASRLLRRDKVRDRVRELVASSAKDERIDKDRITAMLLEDRELAHQRGQAAAALAITVQLAKLHGLKLDGSDISPSAQKHSPTNQIDFKATNALFSELKRLQ